MFAFDGLRKRLQMSNNAVQRKTAQASDSQTRSIHELHWHTRACSHTQTCWDAGLVVGVLNVPCEAVS